MIRPGRTHHGSARALVALALAPLWWAGCGTIELGDNIVAPNVRVDEDRFYCEIAPQILAARSCATGGTVECTGTSCHASTSSFRLSEAPMLPRCEDGVPIDPIDPQLADDYRSVTVFLGSDARSSPFFRRPVRVDSHPCQVFSETSAEAELIANWIETGAL
ncbi:MAG: hypothetical protein OHK0013_40390 [Sandaracinaceae bacterium]